MKVTVFTPTYNRAYIIEKLYQSLQRQTVTDFEWLVVDDGSIDNTEDLFKKWIKENNKFPIRYYKKENGGKHRAVNYALPLAEGELFFIVDSDDFLTDNSIELLIQMRNTLAEVSDKKYCGVVGCKGYENGKIVGSTFGGEYIDCLSIERSKHNIEGDKAEAFFTEVLRKYPFPEFEGEKFVTEAAVWDKMALDGYYLRYFNKTIYICEYLEDGLTNQGLDLYYKNPKGYGYYLRQSRNAQKFSKGLQKYFDVECYLHWRKQMSAKEIAELIGTKSSIMLCNAYMYRFKQCGSKVKQFLLRILKRGK